LAAWSQLAEIAAHDGKFEEALSCLDRGIELEDHPTLWRQKGDLFDRMDDAEEALRCYERALGRDRFFVSQVTRALRGQATQLAALGRFPEAESKIQVFLELDPADEDTQADLYAFEEIRVAKMVARYSVATRSECNRKRATHANRKYIQRDLARLCFVLEEVA